MSKKVKGHWSKRTGLTSTMIANYMRVQLGAACKPGIKQPSLVCEALAKAGKPKPPGIGSVQWVADNCVHIRTVSQSEPAKALGRAAKQLRSVTGISSDEFLTSYAWRRLRMEALLKYGSRCMCCGATPADGAVMNVDHIKPRKLYPSLALDIDNLQILCHDCNHGKGNWNQTDWRPAQKVCA